MARSSATTVEEYLNELPDDRREVIAGVREVILAHLPSGYEETMNWGMISYEIPLSRYPKTYNGKPLMFAALASQKQYCSLYLMGIYMNQEREKRLREGFKAAGKKLNMGASCIRFKQLEDLPLDTIAEAVSGPPPDVYIAGYEKTRAK